jgi:hypothetical protein
MPPKKKATASAQYKLPIDQVMRAVDLRNGDYYTKLDDTSKKDLSTFMAQRWASQVRGEQDIQEHYLLMVNDLSNIDYIATTSAHEELRWRVLSLVGLGIKMQHEFIPPKGKKKDKLTEWLIELFPNLGDKEIELFRAINPESELQEIAEHTNMSNKRTKELFK